MTPAQVLAAAEAVEFSPSWLRPGYDRRQVDDLVAAIVDAVMTQKEVRPVVDRVQLVPFRFRAGYRGREVDVFLERVAGPGLSPPGRDASPTP